MTINIWFFCKEKNSFFDTYKQYLDFFIKKYIMFRLHSISIIFRKPKSKKVLTKIIWYDMTWDEMRWDEMREVRIWIWIQSQKFIIFHTSVTVEIVYQQWVYFIYFYKIKF